MSADRNHARTSIRIRLLLPVSLVLTVTVTGTLGYLWIGREQDASFLDALYMTIITITTVGYGEIIHLDSAGRIFTMFVAITGVGSLFYSLTVIMDYLVAARLNDPHGEKRMQREIGMLSKHILLAGLGRVGRQAATELSEAKVPFVIIDPRPEIQHYAAERGFLFLTGDASDDAVLERAGIRSASGLIVTTGDDANNIYIVLSARVLNPNLFIVSRAVNDSSVSKLIRAGANRAISPYAIGGRRLAHLILSPSVVDFFDTVLQKGKESLNLEGITISDGSAAIGKQLGDLGIRERTGASALVLIRDTRVIPNPGADLTLNSGDQILALGTSQQLEKLEVLLSA